MRYAINLKYTTGDSFKSYETEGELPMTWKNLEKAKEALQILKEFETAYQKANRYNATDKDREALKKTRGYVKGEYGFANFGVPLDDGTIQTMYPFWQGYFETLNAAEIVVARDELNPNGDTDMKVTF